MFTIALEPAATFSVSVPEPLSDVWGGSRVAIQYPTGERFVA